VITIDRAAIVLNGHVYSLPRPARHPAVGIYMVEQCGCPKPYPSGEAQGFLTSDGRFVSREEAARIAIAAGQVDADEIGTRLFTEDLW